MTYRGTTNRNDRGSSTARRRRRWCLVVDSSKSRPWTAEELAIDPVLAMTFRPTAMAVGPLYLAMDLAAQLPVPFMDTLRESPFWTGERVR